MAESPWVLPRDVFARRADRLRRTPGGASYDRERAALDPPGSVLDVGAGAGAACLPLASRTTALTAVDTDDGMLARLDSRARAAGLEPRLLTGCWPDVADQAAPADLVTCHHVLYNVPDLAPFIDALTRYARRQVVVELTAAHPLISLNPLWLIFHGLERPEGPAAADVLAILAAMGVRAGHTEWNRPAQADYATGSELVETTRRRLCLPPERAADVEAVLREAGYLGQPGRPRDLRAVRGDDLVGGVRVSDTPDDWFRDPAPRGSRGSAWESGGQQARRGRRPEPGGRLARAASAARREQREQWEQRPRRQPRAAVPGQPPAGIRPGLLRPGPGRPGGDDQPGPAVAAPAPDPGHHRPGRRRDPECLAGSCTST